MRIPLKLSFSCFIHGADVEQKNAADRPEVRSLCRERWPNGNRRSSGAAHGSQLRVVGDCDSPRPRVLVEVCFLVGVVALVKLRGPRIRDLATAL